MINCEWCGNEVDLLGEKPNGHVFSLTFHSSINTQIKSHVLCNICGLEWVSAVTNITNMVEGVAKDRRKKQPQQATAVVEESSTYYPKEKGRYFDDD